MRKRHAPLVRLLAPMVMLASLSTAARADPEGVPANAFVFEARFAGAFSLASGAATSAFVPGLMLGGRLANRVNIGADIFLTNLTISGSGGPGTNVTAFTLGPIAEIDLIRAAHDKVQFYGKVALGFGDATGSGGSNTFLLRFDLGAGVRYAPVSFFALGFESGFLGVFIGPDKPGTFGVVSLYGGLVGTFMYGK